MTLSAAVVIGHGNDDVGDDDAGKKLSVTQRLIHPIGQPILFPTGGGP